MKVKVTQSCPTLCDPMDYSPWNSPCQNTGVGSLSLLQGIFPTQGSNPSFLHCRWILYQLSYGKHAAVSKNTYIGITGCTLAKILIAESCTCSSICDGCQFHDQSTLLQHFRQIHQECNSSPPKGMFWKKCVSCSFVSDSL